jgi:hypothetical protein
LRATRLDINQFYLDSADDTESKILKHADKLGSSEEDTMRVSLPDSTSMRRRYWICVSNPRRQPVPI